MVAYIRTNANIENISWAGARCETAAEVRR